MSRCGPAAAAAVVLIRISTDIEINGNEQPEGISVAGKDIRCPSQVTSPGIVRRKLCRRFSRFPARAFGKPEPGTLRISGAKIVDGRPQPQCLEGLF
jgi:hypothetical protein